MFDAKFFQHTHTQTYQMACVCSVGFGLNCIFIIIVVGVKINSVAFSFCGLVLTEIVPTVFMLMTFGSMSTLKSLFLGGTKSVSSLGSLVSLSSSQE